MNLYQLMWDQCGYGKRYRKVHATTASDSRKKSALSRIWKRMTNAEQRAIRSLSL